SRIASRETENSLYSGSSAEPSPRDLWPPLHPRLQVKVIVSAPLLPPPPPPSPQVPAFQTPSTDRLLLLRATQRSESVQHRCVRATNESALIHFMTV
ncbi:hypothetical protein IscW_ISCW004514, partial [Ixodes scapularis]